MTYPEIQRELVETGKAQYVFKNFPLEGPHPFAMKSAEAAACAGQQGKFWDMHGVLFRHQDALAPANLHGYAEDIGLDLVRFDTCMNGEMTGRIRADQIEGRQLGVNSTPTLLIGIRLPDGTVRVRQKLTGVVPPDRLLQFVREIVPQ